MKIETNSYLEHVKAHRLELIQISTLNMNIISTTGGVLEVEYVETINATKDVVKEYQEFPDSFFVNLVLKNGWRIAFGKEEGFLHLSRVGFLCLVDEIYDKIRKEMDVEVAHFEKTKSTIDPVEDAVYLSEYTKKIDEFKLFTKEKYIELILKKYDKVEQNTVKYASKNKDKLFKSRKNKRTV